MPVSNTLHLPTVIHFVESVEHHRVLDVGIGTGSYGFMLRQFLDISQERVAPESWEVTIDGIEVFEGYRNPVWEYAYDRVVIGDAREALDRVGQYDVVVCCDVLEHFDQAEARAIIAKCLQHGTALIATTPNGAWEQGAWGGNEAERHRCVVTEHDFPNLAAVVRTGATSCYVASNDPKTRAQLERAAIGSPAVINTFGQLFARKLRSFRGRLR